MNQAAGAAPTADSTAISGSFAPSAGQTLLFIGQDTDDYVAGMATVPAGVHKTADLDYLAEMDNALWLKAGPDLFSALGYPQ